MSLTRWINNAMEYYSAMKRNKLLIDDDLDASQRHYAEWEKPVSELHTLWFHLHDVLGGTKLSWCREHRDCQSFWVGESMAIKGVFWGHGTILYPSWGGGHIHLYVLNLEKRKKSQIVLSDNFLNKTSKIWWFETRSSPCLLLSLPQFTAFISSKLCSRHSPQTLT